MSKENKNTVKEALLEMQNIQNAIKKESTNTIKELLGEAVKDAIRDSISNSEDDDKECAGDKTCAASKKDMEKKDMIIDAEDKEDKNSGEEEPEEKPEDANEEAPEDGDDADLSKYEVGDGTYDFTGEDDSEKLMKVFKKLDDGERVLVRRDNDTLRINDKETGAEYVIDLSDEGEENEPEGLDEANIAGIPDDMDDEEYDDELEDMVDDDDDFELDIDAEEPMDGDNDLSLDIDNDAMDEPIMERQKRENMKRKDALFEIDLGYTDNYQDKDVIEGLSNSEPSKSGRKIDAGVPDGTSKPWAGKTDGKGKPFTQKVAKRNEMNEEEDMFDVDMAEDAVEESTRLGSRKIRKGEATKTSKYAKLHYGDGNVSAGGEHYSTLPSGLNRGEKELNEAYKREIKTLKKAVNEMRQNFNETYVTCVNLGKITKLLMENSTTHDEKVEILNRFSNESKTVEDATKLYESISKELKNRKPKKLTMESKSTAQEKKAINESQEKKTPSPELLRTLDLMNKVLEY